MRLRTVSTSIHHALIQLLMGGDTIALNGRRRLRPCRKKMCLCYLRLSVSSYNVLTNKFIFMKLDTLCNLTARHWWDLTWLHATGVTRVGHTSLWYSDPMEQSAVPPVCLEVDSLLPRRRSEQTSAQPLQWVMRYLSRRAPWDGETAHARLPACPFVGLSFHSLSLKTN